MIARITQLFPLWAVLLSVCAFVQPALFTSLKTLIVPMLMLIMLAMGLTLSLRDFANVVRHKTAILLGVILQFTVMPLLALIISHLFSFPPDLTVGMLLVGCVAGGTSSNVMTYLAKGDVALSISMTAVSTILGVVLTPLLVGQLAGKSVDVNVLGMLMSLVKIVFIPVAIGIAVNMSCHGVVRKLEPILPLVSMLGILSVIGIVVALNRDALASHGIIIALAVMLHNSCGLAAGYWACRLFGFNRRVARTISFEVGLQNSGLATALAMNFFSSTAAIPGTLFSVWHNISGSLLAGFWSRRSVDEETETTAKTAQPSEA